MLQVSVSKIQSTALASQQRNSNTKGSLELSLGGGYASKLYLKTTFLAVYSPVEDVEAEKIRKIGFADLLNASNSTTSNYQQNTLQNSMFRPFPRHHDNQLRESLVTDCT